MIEFTLVLGLLLLASFGTIDFSFAYFQWNSASKAVQLGARLAAVSNPVASDLATLTGLEGGAQPGNPMPYFERVCSGATATCTGGTYDAVAMNRLVARMSQIFPQIRAANVIIRYTHTGLGFAGRPGGPVPTIAVELNGLTFNFFFLDALLGLGPIQMPTMTTTVTGEDLSTVGS